MVIKIVQPDQTQESLRLAYEVYLLWSILESKKIATIPFVVEQ
jgi:hypothetical protein